MEIILQTPSRREELWTIQIKQVEREETEGEPPSMVPLVPDYSLILEGFFIFLSYLGGKDNCNSLALESK
jgi:hypothetical protein